MKKVLLGTTAIVAAGMIASSPVLAAEKLSAKVGGYMEQWFGYVSQDSIGGADLDGFDIKSDTEVFFTGSTTLDNGIEFGVNIQLEGNTNSDQIDESYLIVKGSFGEINLGSENSAMYKMNYGPTDYGIGLNSGDQTDWVSAAGVGGTTGQFRGPFGSTNVEAGRLNDVERLTYYTPRLGGFQFGASYTPSNSEDSNAQPNRDATGSSGLHDGYSFGANYQGEFSGVALGVSGGWGTISREGSGVDDPTTWSVGATIGYAGFELGAAYADAKDDVSVGDMQGYNIGLAYKTGPLGISIGWFHGERDGSASTSTTGFAAQMDTYHLSAAYTLGPGVTAAATLGHNQIEADDSRGTDNEGTYLVTGIKLSF